MSKLGCAVVFVLVLALFGLSSGVSLPANLAAPIDCSAANLTSLPKSMPNPCVYINMVQNAVQNFTPPDQLITKQLVTNLFANFKSKLAESYSAVKRKNIALFNTFSVKDPVGLNATALFFAKLTNPNSSLVLDNETCNAYLNDFQKYELSLNRDGLTSAKQVFCLVISDFKTNLPMTIAYFMFTNGKAIQTLQQNEKNNLAPLKDLLSKFTGAKTN